MRTEQSIALPPRWVLIGGSIILLFHVFAMLIAAFDATSGPWPTPMGPSPAEPPPFAYHIAEHVTLPYTRLIKMASSFHFYSNKQESQEVLFEARLKNESGKVINTYRFPDPSANPWLRYRQRLLAQQLGNDEPLPPQQGVIIPPVGQQLPKLRWWQPEGEKRLKLIEGTSNDVPRNQQLMQPSTLSYITAKSYARYLAKTGQADKVEIVREWFDPINPVVLFRNEQPPDDLFTRFYATYGDLPK
jgi:hypothetical protein